MVTPELSEEIKIWLERKDGDIETLSFFYKQAFGRELKINCPGCIGDAKDFLKRLVNKKQPEMQNYKWVGGNAKVRFRGNDGQVVSIDKTNCTDYWAEKISAIEKYAHNVEALGSAVKPLAATRKLTEVKSEATISTSAEVLKEKTKAKPKKAKAK